MITQTSRLARLGLVFVLLLSWYVVAALDFFTENYTDWSADFPPLRGYNATAWTPTPGLAVNGQFAWEKSPDTSEDLSQMTVHLGINITADLPFNETYETFFGWALLAKGSRANEFTLYEGGVL